MRTLLFLVISLMLATGCGQQKEVQGDDSATQLISARNFVFKASTAQPARGRSIQLTSDYTLTVSTDSIIAFLPYYGRAYTAPIGRTSGGIEFTSTDFAYKEDQKKNGAYEIEIIPRDVPDVRRLFLSISKNGYGSLHVTSQNRQQISFNGAIGTR